MGHSPASACVPLAQGEGAKDNNIPEQEHLPMVLDHMWYPESEGQKGHMHCESPGVTNAVLLPG